MQNLGGWQDDHVEEDVEESQRDLHNCAITGPHAERFAGGVLSHYPALVHLDLSGNQIGPDGAESLADSCRSAGAVSSTGSPQSQPQSDR